MEDLHGLGSNLYCPLALKHWAPDLTDITPLARKLRVEGGELRVEGKELRVEGKR